LGDWYSSINYLLLEYFFIAKVGSLAFLKYSGFYVNIIDEFFIIFNALGVVFCLFLVIITPYGGGPPSLIVPKGSFSRDDSSSLGSV
jgi:hypothetical protein